MIATLHLILLLGFIGVTSLLLIVTVTNRFRLRRVLLTWRSRRYLGVPVGPTIFLGVVLGLLGASLLTDHALNAGLFLGYVVGGGFWFVAAWLSSTVIVSDYGLVLNSNCTDRAVAWGQIVDYFEFERASRRGYVFFFADGSGDRRRLELPVPIHLQKRFQKVVRSKVDARLEFSLQQVYGKQALEG
jgi:hypothetical protein